MDVTALFKAVLAPGQESGTERFGGLQPGDGLTGKVLRIEADGRLLIDLGRFRALAQSPMAALPGEVLHFKVESVGHPIHLRLRHQAETTAQRPVPEISPAAIFSATESHGVVKAIERLIAQLTTADPATASLRQALGQLATLFLKPGPDASAQQWVDALRSHLTDSGHLFEGRLADVLEKAPQAMDAGQDTAIKSVLTRDMKPNLLLLRSLLSLPENRMPFATDSVARELVLLRQTVDRLLGHVEQQQERGLQRASEGDAFQVFSHSIPVRENADPVRIKVYYPRKKAGGQGQGQHRIALLLDLDHLGSVRADIFMAGALLNIRFFVMDQAVKEVFDDQLHTVEKVLAEHFQQVDVAAFVSSEKIARFTDEDLAPVPAGSVDVRI